MNVQIYADTANIESNVDNLNVTLTGVDLSQILAEFNAKDVLEALAANDHYSEIVEYVAENPDDYED